MCAVNCNSVRCLALHNHHFMLLASDVAWLYSGVKRKYIHLSECASESETDSTKLDTEKNKMCAVLKLTFNL